MMLFFSLTPENDDVIHVDGHYPLIHELFEDVVHHHLEGGGLFIKPKNITRGSKRPQFVQKAAFHSSPSLIHMLLYPQQMSSFVKYLALASETLLRMSWIKGRG